MMRYLESGSCCVLWLRVLAAGREPHAVVALRRRAVTARCAVVFEAKPGDSIWKDKSVQDAFALIGTIKLTAGCALGLPSCGAVRLAGPANLLDHLGGRCGSGRRCDRLAADAAGLLPKARCSIATHLAALVRGSEERDAVMAPGSAR